jgi:alpha-L-fucosidase
MAQQYKPTWSSLKTHPTAEWMRKAKFGIYTHWGIYCVPATGPNVTWYPYNMYRKGTPQFEYHKKTYGDQTKFGYKDFIPMFTAENFDPDEWAELFKKAGAKFAGPVAEHHDGFPMWDCSDTEWSAAKMGPKRDVVGELEKAIRAQGMKYMVAMHHAENWWFFPHWKKEYDTSDPQYAGLYGESHNEDFDILPETLDMHDEWAKQDKPSKAFLDRWKNRLVEVVDRYTPDYIWFDFGIRYIHQQYVQDFLAYYYNKESEWGREVVATYKWHDIPPGAALLDFELGKTSELTHYEWITDTTVDDGQGWGYIKETEYKTVTEMVHYLTDNVSKNGFMLLNVGPKPDGTIPDESKAILEGMGEWLAVNGEAIYDTVPWNKYGEGPTKMEHVGAFSDTKEKIVYTPEDIRFTVNDNVLYATTFGWPQKEFVIESANVLYPGEVRSVEMLGHNGELKWEMSDAGLKIERPDEKPCDHAYAFKITRNTNV